MPYKVVQERWYGDYPVLISAWAIDPTNPRIGVQLRYRPNEWTSARTRMAEEGYYPLVFKTLKQARNFIAYNKLRDAQIWHCRTRGRVHPLPAMLYLWGLFDYGEFSKISLDKDLWPSGTIMAREVMITERVE